MLNKRQELLQTLIGKLTRTIHNLYMDQGFLFGDFKLGKQQIMILFFVYEKKGAAAVKEIAEFLHVTSGAVTQFVDGLVAKKIIQRVENPFDHRSTNIKLTADTEKKFDNFRQKFLESAGQYFNGLGDRELKQFIELVKKIKIPNR